MIEITQALALIAGVVLGLLTGDQVKLMISQSLNVRDWEQRFGVRG
jgi:hypothetical protein